VGDMPHINFPHSMIEPLREVLDLRVAIGLSMSMTSAGSKRCVRKLTLLPSNP